MRWFTTGLYELREVHLLLEQRLGVSRSECGELAEDGHIDTSFEDDKHVRGIMVRNLLCV
jgi:hypothetical protein